MLKTVKSIASHSVGSRSVVNCLGGGHCNI
jgi:hypothetical protein